MHKGREDGVKIAFKIMYVFNGRPPSQTAENLFWFSNQTISLSKLTDLVTIILKILVYYKTVSTCMIHSYIINKKALDYEAKLDSLIAFNSGCFT